MSAFQPGDVVQVRAAFRTFFSNIPPGHHKIKLVARGSGPLGSGWCYVLEGSGTIIREEQLEKVSLLERMAADEP